MEQQFDTPAGPVRRGTLLKFQPHLGQPVFGSVLDATPHGRNGRTTLTLECGDAGRWCYLDQVIEVVDY
jgi:hypothetical protein